MEVSTLTSSFNTLNIGSLSMKHIIVTTNYDTFIIYNFTDDDCYHYAAESVISNFKFFIVNDSLYIIYSIDYRHTVESRTVLIALSLTQQSLILVAKNTFNHIWTDFFHLDGYLVNINVYSSGLYYNLMDLDMNHIHSDNFPCSDCIINVNSKYYSMLEEVPVEITIAGGQLQYLRMDQHYIHGEHYLILNIPPLHSDQLFIKVLATNYYQNYAGDLYCDGYMISTGMSVAVGSKFVRFKFENLYVVSEGEYFAADCVVNSIVNNNIYYIDVSNEERLTINSAFKKSITSIASDRGLVRIWVPE